jgi:hypothetical protein
MATRIVFANGSETSVTENEADVVAAIRRDDPNPVKLESLEGLVLYINWQHVTLIGPRPEPSPLP